MTPLPDVTSRAKLDWRTVKTVTKRDLMLITRSRSILLPIVLVPLILLVLMPAAIGILIPTANNATDLQDLQRFFDMMPATMVSEFRNYTPTQTMVVFLLVYMFAPLFLILPIMTASTIAAGSFAGEKERRTLEALLYTPATDAELVLGKMLSAMVPAVLVSLIGAVLYAAVANVSAWSTMHQIFIPNLMWIVLIIWLSPAAAALGLGTMILVSTKVSTFQDAYQLGSMVVIPVVLLILGQVGGVVYLSPIFVFLVGLVLWAVDAVILWFAVRTFRRSEIIARL